MATEQTRVRRKKQLRARVDQNTKDNKQNANSHTPHWAQCTRAGARAELQANARRSIHRLEDVDAIDVHKAGAIPEADVRIV